MHLNDPKPSRAIKEVGGGGKGAEKGDTEGAGLRSEEGVRGEMCEAGSV
jgi:hypothetical protein